MRMAPLAVRTTPVALRDGAAHRAASGCRCTDAVQESAGAARRLAVLAVAEVAQLGGGHHQRERRDAAPNGESAGSSKRGSGGSRYEQRLEY